VNDCGKTQNLGIGSCCWPQVSGQRERETEKITVTWRNKKKPKKKHGVVSNHLKKEIFKKSKIKSYL
jgi:hypothetical protein